MFRQLQGKPLLRAARSFRLVGVLALLSLGSPLAASDTRLQILITGVLGIDCMDTVPCDGASFYATVTFDNAIHSNIRSNAPWHGRDSIAPNWRFSWREESTKTVAVTVEIWDEDGWFRGAPDQLDIDPSPDATPAGRTLSFDVDLAACAAGAGNAVRGELTGPCGTFTSSGAEAGVRGRITFRVSALVPPDVPGMRIRCLHEPLWPQQGDTVTITAEALSDAPIGKTAVTADTLSVELSPSANWPNASNWSRTCNAATTCATTFTARADDLRYTCAATRAGASGVDRVETGSRSVAVGPQASGAVPVLSVAPRSGAIDIVFIAARQRTTSAGTTVNYASPRAAVFQRDVARFIRGLYDWDTHNVNQDALNFYIATDLTDFVGSTECDLRPPPAWASTYAFAEAGTIVHNDPGQDCAQSANRISTSQSGSITTLAHETAHAPFGLADEYDSDNGTRRFQPDPLPNTYRSRANCEADIAALRAWDPTRTKSDCREITDGKTPPNGLGWWTSDPPANDLMNDNQQAQAAELRRINWIYDACREASCVDLRP